MLTVFLLFFLLLTANSSFENVGAGYCTTNSQIMNYYELTGVTACETACNCYGESACLAYYLWSEQSLCYLFVIEETTSIVSCNTGSLRISSDGAGWITPQTVVGSTGSGSTDCMKRNLGSASGDPHIESVYGCAFEAPVNPSQDVNKAVLMSCEDEELIIKYTKASHNHISEVVHKKGEEITRFVAPALVHPQKVRVCGNVVQFYRNIAGINLHMRQLHNYNFTGLLADKSCLQE